VPYVYLPVFVIGIIYIYKEIYLNHLTFTLNGMEIIL
jgi:hypothetical protein